MMRWTVVALTSATVLCIIVSQVCASLTTDTGIELIKGTGTPTASQLVQSLTASYSYYTSFVSATFTAVDQLSELDDTLAGPNSDFVNPNKSAYQYVFFMCDDYSVPSILHYRVRPVPFAAFPVIFPYRLDGVSGQVVLSMQVLGAILLGDITNWDDSALVQLNPTLSLPDKPIRVVLYNASAVATYLVFLALSQVVNGWNQRVSPATGLNATFPVYNSSRTIFGPVNNALAWLTLLQSVDGTLGYALYPDMLNLAYTDCAFNRSGVVVTASTDSTTLAMNAFSTKIEGLLSYSESLVNADDPNAWPICGFVHAGLSLITNKDCDYATEILSMLTWMNLNDASRNTMLQLGFAPQTIGIRTHIADATSSVRCGSALVFENVVVSGYGLSTISPLWQAWARTYTVDIGNNIYVNMQVTPLAPLTAGLLARDIKFAAVVETYFDAFDNADGADILVVPSFAYGMSIAYNIPELNPQLNVSISSSLPALNVTGQILADIFMGAIKTWNHPDIATANPQLRGKLPNQPITVLVYNVPVYITQLFIEGIDKLGSNYTTIPVDQSTNWTQIGTARTVSVTTKSAISVLQKKPYSICYVNHMVVTTQGNGVAQEAFVINKRGNAVGPTSDNVLSALLDFAPKGIVTSDDATRRRRAQSALSASLVAGPGEQSYPFSSLGYVAFHTTGQEINCPAATQLLDFIYWTQSYTNSYRVLDKFDATILTDKIQNQVLELLAKVKCNNTFALDIASCLSNSKICSDNGVCSDGACLCRSGWSGKYCADDGSVDLSVVYIVALTVGVPGICLCCILFIIITMLIVVWKRPVDRPWAVDFSEIELKQQIGAGGYGAVHKAIWKDSDVAVKLLNTGNSISRENKVNFVSEVKIMTQLRHPNVVLFMGACTTPPNLCIIMEYMELGSLYDVLHNELVPRLPTGLKIKLATQAAQGMHFLHSSGILHRDLKSPNILLDDKWNAKISDFGLTRLKEHNSDSNMDKLAGSLYWTAPEILGETMPFSEPSDVYSFGIILWELLTGADPYEGMNPTTVAVCVLRDNLRPPMPRDVQPLEYGEITTSCWDSQVDARPTFLEVVTRLKVLASSTSSAEGVLDSASNSRVHNSMSMGGSSSPFDGGTNTTTSDSHSSSHDNAKKLAALDRAVHAPTGEVALVMTDINQAGALWEFDPEAMKQATILHNTLLRASLQEMNGYEVHLQGDHVLTSGEGSFCIAFQHAADAVRWATTTQYRLVSAEWEAKLLAHPAAAEEWAGEDDQVVFKGLRVQMGIHLGTAQIIRDPMTRRIEYTGQLVHKAAKLASMAHGGQILVTRAVYKALKQSHHDDVAVSVGTLLFAATEPAMPIYEIKPHNLAGRFFGGLSPRLDRGTHRSRKQEKGEKQQGSRNNVRAFASLSMNDSESDQSAVEMDSLTDARHGSGNGEPDTDAGGRVQLNSANLCRWVINWTDVELGKQIGMGSYGIVYKARWRGVDVAVKRFIKQKLSERHMLDFRAEVAFLSEMHHPNIVLFIGACMKSPNLCILTEYVKHGSLRDVLSNKSIKLSWQMRMKIAKTAALGVYYLHSLEPVIMHRDLKTSNILIDENWNAKVADFGFARIKLDNATMTKCGSPCWTAPEVIEGKKYTEKADVYSFGIILWEILTRAVPYKGRNHMNISLDIVNGVRPKMPNNAPVRFARLITRCWRANPEKRPAMGKVVAFFEDDHKPGDELSTSTTVSLLSAAASKQSQQHSSADDV
eukprot:TRINITY_DN138_c0_g1_i2.p1 TRINITY_DN138_c0_g1~~TRINITY_DN138_c0_g1_i2.p1  ORF type:complete len:1733 (-),score=273.96 TRINITY_DN138_c0_g1_i2:43-5241(-)